MMQMKAGLASILRFFEVLPSDEGKKFYPPQYDAKSFAARVLGGNKVRIVSRSDRLIPH